jgi:hypothetical protein
MISNVDRVRGGNVTRVGDRIRTLSNQQDVIAMLSAQWESAESEKKKKLSHDLGHPMSRIHYIREQP